MAGGFTGLIGLKGFPSPKDEHLHHELMEAQPGIREDSFGLNTESDRRTGCEAKDAC